MCGVHFATSKQADLAACAALSVLLARAMVLPVTSISAASSRHAYASEGVPGLWLLWQVLHAD